jgi:hemerythrin-like domain-containing protein
MKLTLDSFYKDHDNLRRILFLLEQLLIEIYRGSSTNYQMVQRILAYIQDYPERVHHPAEDAMFSVILKNGIADNKLHDAIIKLMRDHSQIEAITRNAIKVVEPVVVSTHHDITRVGDVLLTLITRQRAHLLFEEMDIYPCISEHLSREHWDQISDIIPDTEDPIFSENVSKEYEIIFKAL